MPKSPRSVSMAPHLPLKFVGGDPSLDFVNTVDWTESGLVNDRLVDYGGLVEWAQAAGLLRAEERSRLLRSARSRAAQAAYQRARWGRWIIQRLFASFAAGKPSPLDDFNDLLHGAYRRTRLVYAADAADGSAVAWRGLANDLDVVLWTVVRAAADLLTSAEIVRLRACAGPDCGWMYVDRSRNGLRRWCEMQTCGTLAKSRRRASRRRTARTA
jgi:predicted RNA-binding Zn ribbon-like protein